VVLRLRLPLTPVSVSVYWSGAVAGLVVTDSVDDVPVRRSTGFGVNEAAVPVGSPLTPRLTDPVKPPVGVIVTV
jgi:hypothetical protein